MTSRLHKKRPTTPPNTIPSDDAPRRRCEIRHRRRLAGLLAVATVLSGAGVAVADEPGAEMLESLKQRTAAEHWESTARMFPTARPAPGKLPSLPSTEESQRTVADELPSPGRLSEHRPDPNRQAALPPKPGERRATAAMQNLPPTPPVYDPPVKSRNSPAVADEVGMAPGVRGIAQTPDQLRDVRDILPYYDYDPIPGSVDEGSGRMPKEIPLGTEPFVGRSLPRSVFAWKAANITHNPLYFQDVALERYGHTYGPLAQPVVSVGRFSAQLLALPYQMTLNHPCREMYPLGYYRPGEWAPKLLYQPPLNAKAALVTAGFYTGMGFVLP